MQQAIALINQLLAANDITLSDNAIVTNVNNYYFQVIDQDQGIEVSTIKRFSQESKDYILVGYQAEVFKLPKTSHTVSTTISIAKKDDETFPAAHDTFSRIINLINI